MPEQKTPPVGSLSPEISFARGSPESAFAKITHVVSTVSGSLRALAHIHAISAEGAQGRARIAGAQTSRSVVTEPVITMTGVTWPRRCLYGCNVSISRYHDAMAKQTTVRLPEELADDAEAVARVKGTSVNALIVDALKAEIERVRQDEDFTRRAKRLLERDRELLERLAR